MIPTDDIAALRRAARAALPGDEAALEADLLIGHALQRSRAWLLAHADARPSDAEHAEIARLLAARAAGVPIAQLTGSRGFWTLELAVDAHTLIPRPETERLVELALARLPVGTAATVADLGTGSGAIALALARERPQLQVIATDASAAALAVARRNAEAHDLRNVEFRHGDWCQALDKTTPLTMIVSNPPYLAEDDPHLQQGDLRFEPRSALASGADGLDALREISATAPRHLATGGWLLLEHGMEQGPAVRDLLRQAGFGEVSTERDLEDRERVSLGRMPQAMPRSEAM